MAKASVGKGGDLGDKVDASMRVVILRGPDLFQREEHSRRLVEALNEKYGAIDQFSFDGASTEPAVVLDELRSYGLLQEHKLIVVDAADKFLASAKDEEGGTKSAPASPGPPGPGRGKRGKRPAAPKTTRELMETYAAAPVDSATLLLRAETWRTGRLDKAVVQTGGAIIECKPPSAASAASWCVGRCRKRHGTEISRDAAMLLVGRIGSELARLDVELGKLAAFVGEDREIDAGAIREVVGLSREEQAWEIQAAILSGSPGTAATKLRELLIVSRHPEVLIAWAMTDLLRKLHAASQLLRRGENPRSVAKQLRLWADADAVIDVGRRVAPERIAQLLRLAIRTDMGSKSGLGSAPRSLEALAVQIADTIRAA